MKELHVISPGTMSLPRFISIASRIYPYVQAIHLRETASTALELWECTQLMIRLGVPAGQIYVNDRLDVAWFAGVAAVHLAHHSLPVKEVAELAHALRIGRSVHSVEEAKRSEAEGADYLFFGHIFPSSSKPGLPPQGLKTLSMVTRAVSVPVIAIGGIRPEDVPDLLEHGAQGVAVMSGIVDAPDPVLAARHYAKMLNEREEEHAAIV